MGQVLHFLWIHLLGACNVKGPLSVPSGTLPCSGRSQPSHASCQLFITAYYYYCVYEMLPMCQALRQGPKTYLHGIYFPGSFLSLLNKQTIKKKKICSFITQLSHKAFPAEWWYTYDQPHCKA